MKKKINHFFIEIVRKCGKFPVKSVGAFHNKFSKFSIFKIEKKKNVMTKKHKLKQVLLVRSKFNLSKSIGGSSIS